MLKPFNAQSSTLFVLEEWVISLAAEKNKTRGTLLHARYFILHNPQYTNIRLLRQHLIFAPAFPFHPKCVTCSPFLPEVGAAGGENDSVGVDLLSAHDQHHVAELPVLPEQVDHLQGLPRVLVGDIGHARGLGDALGQLVGVPQGAAAGDVHSRGVLACTDGPGERGSLIYVE